MPLTRSPTQSHPESMVQTRSTAGPTDITDLEMEKLKQDLEKVSLEAAKSRSENETLRKQLDKLIAVNETLLAEREDRNSVTNMQGIGINDNTRNWKNILSENVFKMNRSY